MARIAQEVRRPPPRLPCFVKYSRRLSGGIGGWRYHGVRVEGDLNAGGRLRGPLTRPLRGHPLPRGERVKKAAPLPRGERVATSAFSPRPILLCILHILRRRDGHGRYIRKLQPRGSRHRRRHRRGTRSGALVRLVGHAAAGGRAMGRGDRARDQRRPLRAGGVDALVGHALLGEGRGEFRPVARHPRAGCHRRRRAAAGLLLDPGGRSQRLEWRRRRARVPPRGGGYPREAAARAWAAA